MNRRITHPVFNSIDDVRAQQNQEGASYPYEPGLEEDFIAAGGDWQELVSFDVDFLKQMPGAHTWPADAVHRSDLEFYLKRNKDTLVIIIGESWVYGESQRSSYSTEYMAASLYNTVGARLALYADADLHQYSIPGNSNALGFEGLRKVLKYHEHNNYEKVYVVYQLTEPFRCQRSIQQLPLDNPFYDFLKRYAKHPEQAEELGAQLLQTPYLDANKKKHPDEVLFDFDDVYLSRIDQLSAELGDKYEFVAYKNFTDWFQTEQQREQLYPNIRTISDIWLFSMIREHSGIDISSKLRVLDMTQEHGYFCEFAHYNMDWVIEEVDKAEVVLAYITGDGNPNNKEWHHSHPLGLGHDYWANRLVDHFDWRVHEPAARYSSYKK